MKKIILIFCLALTATTLSAQRTIYEIDNKTVENFDGSQLIGKTIKEYKISTTGKGRDAITVHSVSTVPSVYSVSGFVSTSEDSLKIWKSKKKFQRDYLNGHLTSKIVVYVIDGVEQKDAEAFQSLRPSLIKSITVLKAGSSEALKYGDDCDVILVETDKYRVAINKLIMSLPGVKVEEDGTFSINGKRLKSVTIVGNGKKVIINNKMYDLDIQ